MKLYVTLLVLFFSSTISCLGQNLALDWIGSMEGPMESQMSYYGCEIMQDNSVVSYGVFRNSIFIDGIEYASSDGSADFFIHKLDQNGNTIWVKILGNEGDEYCSNLILDNEDNIILTGYYSENFDSDPGMNEYLLYAIEEFPLRYIIKLDSDGQFIWANSWGNNNGFGVQDVASDEDGNLYFYGVFHEIMDFDLSESVYELESDGFSVSIFILKLDSDGGFIWVKTLDNNSLNTTYSSDILIQGNSLYISGIIGNTNTDFDPGPDTFNLDVEQLHSSFVEKLDLQGNFEWVRIFYSDDFLGATDLEIGLNEDIYVIIKHNGVFYSNDSYSESFLSTKNDDLTVVKINAEGNLIWHKNFGWVNGIIYNSTIKIDTMGNLSLAGNFSNAINTTSDQNNVVFNNGEKDVYLIKLNPDGEYIGSMILGGDYNDGLRDLDVFSDDSFLICGLYRDIVDFDPTSAEYILDANSTEYSRAFIARYRGCEESFVIDNVTTCDSYTWNANDSTYQEEGQFYHTLTNVSGCDSVVQLNLNFTQFNTEVYYEDFILSSAQDSAEYQWYYCGDDYEPVQGAIDQTFHPLIVGEYAVEITINGDCSMFSECEVVDVISDVENFELIDLNIYPNPTNGELYFSSTILNGMHIIKLYNILGQKVYKGLHSPKELINLTHLESGTYIMTIDNKIRKQLILF